MDKITSSTVLKLAIAKLEQQQASQWPLLKEEILNTAESLKLINILKGTFKEAMAVPDLKTSLLNGAIGLTTGVLAKKIILGRTLNPLSKLLGIILEMAVANKVTKNADGIKSVGNIIMKKLFNRHSEPEKT